MFTLLLSDTFHFLLFFPFVLSMQFIEIYDHCDEDDVPESHEINSSKVLQKIAASIDVNFHKQDKA